MKLNTKGQELYNKWAQIYYKELYRQQAKLNDPEYIEGWCIIDNDEYEHSVDDVIGVMIFGDENAAINNILENYYADEEYAYGFTASEVVEMMKEYFDIDTGEESDINRWNMQKRCRI